ncbi:MAG: protoporphyrinogen oxidase [Myxococcales bacterium]
MNPLIVVGAGAAGLGAAYEARRRGVTALVLEAADRAGGKLGTDEQEGFVTERAALALLDKSGDLGQLCTELGLTRVHASSAAKERYVERDGTVYAMPRGPGDFLKTGFLRGGEKLSLFAEPLRRRSPSDVSVAGFFKKRLGKAGSFLGDTIQTGIYAGDPDSLEMATAFPQLFQLEQQHGSLLRGLMKTPRGKRAGLSSFRRGLQELVDALAKAVQPGLRLGTRVAAIEGHGGSFRLHLEDRTGRAELVAEKLVVALPAPQAADVLSALAPDLAERLRALAAAPISLVHLALRPEDIGPVQHGFGILRPGRPLVGALFPASLFPGRAPAGSVLLSALVGGARNVDAAALPDADLVSLVRAELKLAAQPRLLRVVRWTHALPQYVRGHGSRIAEIETLTAARPGLELAGAFYRGVSVLDCLRDGARAASRLLAA